MSLDWDITNCKDGEAIKTDESWPITDGLIWYTLALDMRQITDGNIDEFETRMRIHDKMFAPLISTWKDEARVDRPITRDELVARIGLSTNVSQKTRKQFGRRMFNAMSEETERKITRERYNNKISKMGINPPEILQDQGGTSWNH